MIIAPIKAVKVILSGMFGMNPFPIFWKSGLLLMKFMIKQNPRIAIRIVNMDSNIFYPQSYINRMITTSARIIGIPIVSLRLNKIFRPITAPKIA